MVKVDDFVKAADDALFGRFTVGLEIDVLRFSMNIGFVFVEVEEVVVATGTIAFSVERHFSFATSAHVDLGLPFELFVTDVTEAFGVMFFLLFAIDADFHNHVRT